MRIRAAYKHALIVICGGVACTTSKVVPANDPHADHVMSSPSTAVADTPSALPPDAAGAGARLSASPRHAEWVMLKTVDGDSLHTWVVYP